MTKIKNNKTFGYGNCTSFNACVGKNGYNDIESYKLGYKNCVEVIVKHLKDNQVNVDSLIYPLLFSARHCLELYLKNLGTIVSLINKNCESNITAIEIEKTHDLKKLWENLKSLSKIDNRFENFILKLDAYITDYFEIDLTGETFRYPFNKNNDHHLDDYSVINILKFEERFNKAINILDDFVFCADFLLEEYNQKTFIKGLSRKIIEEISLELPDRKHWSDSSFKTTKAEIMHKFSISSNTLTKVINLIQKHKEFSSNIGINLPVCDITKDEFVKFKELFLCFHNNIESKKDYIEYKEQISKLIVTNISDSAIYALRTFKEIGFFNKYSEEYSPLLNHFKSKNDSNDLVFSSLLSNQSNINHIESGINKCGQSQLLI